MARASEKSPGKGKKIDTLWFDVDQSSESGTSVETRKVPIHVYMEKKFAGDSEKPPRAATSVWFTLECPETGDKEGSTDLEAALKAMRSKLDRHYRIKWERWLFVRVTPDRIYTGEGAGLALTWEDVERGVTLDGDVLLRRYNMHADWAHRWEIKPWPKQFKDRNGKVLACIPATDKNVAALESFAEKLRELTKTLAEFVAPDRIEETLRAISEGQLRLLSSGDAK